MTKQVRNMPRRQQQAAMANVRRRDDIVYAGRTPHEMIEGSLLYGTDRYTEHGEEFLQRWDRYFGIDPEIGKQERHNRTCERETLLQLDHRGMVADHFMYLQGIRGLLEKGDIRRKARGSGYVITPQGRQRIKGIDAGVARHFRNVRER